MVGEYLTFFQNNTLSNQYINKKFSDTAVILAIAVSKRCTQDLPVVTVRKARVLDFCLPTIRPLQKIVFKEYFFSGIGDVGVPFSINFLSSSGFLGFRKALEQDAMSSSVSGVRRLENF